MNSKPKPVRCAIYTRKSSEEGLELEFNSLHAQREAGESYIGSQKHEGWQVIKTAYDDGGYSGGNIERPALKKLLEDIKHGKIDVVVVYKVDRLSRSLNDFAKIIELFDRHGVSFVSVTQQFNTTTSMGRLTLNILLSFAQFEREVTSERIRDKAEASKKKGLWLGGYPPLGYDVVDKKLVVNHEEAKVVNLIFERYLLFQSAFKVANELNERGLRTKEWIKKDGSKQYGNKYSKCKIYKIVTNPVYIGKIAHKRKKQIYDGQHEPIINQVLWDKVAELIGKQQNARGKAKQPRGTLLARLIEGKDGTPYVPTYTQKPGNKRYSYYIHESSNHRLTASIIEKLIAQTIREIPLPISDSLLESQSKLRWYTIWENFPNFPSQLQNQILRSVVVKIICSKDEIAIRLTIEGIKQLLLDSAIYSSIPMLSEVRMTQIPNYQKSIQISEQYIDLIMQVNFKTSSNRQYITDGDNNLVQPVASSYREGLISALSKAHKWKIQLENGEFKHSAEIAKKENLRTSYVSRILRTAYLSPKIQAAILDGTQPHTFNLQQLRDPFPIRWKDQEKAFGFN